MTYCSFYSQETYQCLMHVSHSLVDAKMGVVRSKCGCGKKITRASCAAIFWPLQPYTCSYTYDR